MANEFAKAFPYARSAKLLAIGSRSKERADSFGKTHGVERCYGSYEELAQDADVDVVYVATPHSCHFENTELAFKYGKHVLCEKPVTVNAKQFAELSEEARSRKLFFMEGMWTRFLPGIVELEKALKEKRIGDIKRIELSLGVKKPFDLKSRIFDPALGGGALLDLGCYAVWFSTWLFGKPDTISAEGEIGKESKVDERIAVRFGYKNGKEARFRCSIREDLENQAELVGTSGRIVLQRPWWHGRGLIVRTSGRDNDDVTPNFVGNGFNYEILEVNRCIEKGEIQSAVHSHHASLEDLKILDLIKSATGQIANVDGQRKEA